MNFNVQQPDNMFDQQYGNNYSSVSIANKPMAQKLAEFSAPQQKFTEETRNRLEYVSSNGQCALIKYGDTVNFNHKERIVTDHTEAILCIFFINDKYIATGSKDKTINIYSTDGSKVTTLRGHAASICCLSMIRTVSNDRYLASGSDHGCSSLILWDTRTWSMHSKVQCHSAAVTAIVDL